MFFISNLTEKEAKAQKLLVEKQAEFQAKMKFGQEALPTLMSKAKESFHNYEIAKSERWLTLILELKPSFKPARTLKGYIAFIKGEYRNAISLIGIGETPLDQAVIKYSQTSRTNADTKLFVKSFFNNRSAPESVIFMRSLAEHFYATDESITQSISWYLSGWPYNRDCRQMLEIAKMLQGKQQFIVLEQLTKILNYPDPPDANRIAKEALRLTDNPVLIKLLRPLARANLAYKAKTDAVIIPRRLPKNAVDGLLVPISNRWDAAAYPTALTIDLVKMTSLSQSASWNYAL